MSSTVRLAFKVLSGVLLVAGLLFLGAAFSSVGAEESYEQLEGTVKQFTAGEGKKDGVPHHVFRLSFTDERRDVRWSVPTTVTGIRERSEDALQPGARVTLRVETATEELDRLRRAVAIRTDSIEVLTFVEGTHAQQQTRKFLTIGGGVCLVLAVFLLVSAAERASRTGPTGPRNASSTA